MRRLLFSAILLLSSPPAVRTRSTTDDTSDLYPPLWQQAPSSLSDFPLSNDSAGSYRLIDPWLYPHRLGLFKILIAATTPYMPFCASSNASNILFALPSQFGWQLKSNRLFTDGTMRISTDSWWASANYYISVIPFLVAVDSGLVSNEPFRIVQREDFCATSTQCLQQVPNAMAQWSLFFFHLQQSAACVADRKLTRRLMDKCYLTQIWSTYTSSINDALTLARPKLDLLPSEAEKLFGLGWARLLNLIAMTRKNTNLHEAMKNQRQFLPMRMLRESDRTGESDDLPPSVRHSLKILFSFRFDWLSFIDQFWSRVTCNYEGRADAQQALETMASSKWLAMYHIFKATMNSLVHGCDQPSDA